MISLIAVLYFILGFFAFVIFQGLNARRRDKVPEETMLLLAAVWPVSLLILLGNTLAHWRHVLGYNEGDRTRDLEEALQRYPPPYYESTLEWEEWIATYEKADDNARALLMRETDE